MGKTRPFCYEHLRYKAIKKPRVACYMCWYSYWFLHPKERNKYLRKLVLHGQNC